MRALWKGARIVSLADAGDAAFGSAARGDLRGPLLWAALLLALGGDGAGEPVAAAAAMKLRPVLEAFARAPATLDLADRLPARCRHAAAGRAPGLERRGAGGLAGGAVSPAAARHRRPDAG